MSTGSDDTPGMIEVEVAYATPAKQALLKVSVRDGSTLEEAIELSGISGEFPGMTVDPAGVGIFGRKVPMGQALKAGDRVEIYRALIADPKEARRRRAELEKESGSKP